MSDYEYKDCWYKPPPVLRLEARHPTVFVRSAEIQTLLTKKLLNQFSYLFGIIALHRQPPFLELYPLLHEISYNHYLPYVKYGPDAPVRIRYKYLPEIVSAH